MDIQKTELGHSFAYQELRNQCRAVWGAVSFPGERPGFAVVCAMNHKRHLDSYPIFLLDEFESFDTRELVRQSAALDLKYFITLHCLYKPDASDGWIGDSKNAAAAKFIEEMNAEDNRTHRGDSAPHREPFRLSSTALLEMKPLYPFVLATLKDLVKAERRMLFLKDSKIKDYLSQIEEGEVADLELGGLSGYRGVGLCRSRDAPADCRRRINGPYRRR